MLLHALDINAVFKASKNLLSSSS